MESSAAPPPAVVARGVGRRFGRHWALAHVDLEVTPGEVLLLAGHNGSGKTTLLRLIAGLYQPTKGSLEVLGMSPREHRLSCRRQLSMISHDSYLYRQLTPLETLRLWARLLGRQTSDRELVPYLEEVGLADRQDNAVAGFSAGMRQRLSLLRARLEAPRLVLLDEPFSALDANGKTLVERWIGDFRASGATVIMVSHELRRAARSADRAVLLERGQPVWQGPPAELVERLESEA